MDFEKIHEKVANYQSFNDFRSDISWFAHNLKTKQLNVNTPRDTVVKAAKALVRLTDEEIKTLLLCTECYSSAFNSDDPDDAFVLLCKPLHILVWADYGEYGYWPAKVLKFNVEDDENMVYVRSFGDHVNLCLPSSGCNIFSVDAPENNSGPSSDEAYKLALKVIPFPFTQN